MRPRLQRHSAARHPAEDFLQHFRTRADPLLHLYLPRFIQHAVPTVAISQIQPDRQFLLRNIPALPGRYGAKETLIKLSAFHNRSS